MFSEKRKCSYKKRLILHLILLVFLLAPTTVIAEPSHEGQFSVYYFADHPIEPERPKVEVPDPILSNCYAYVKSVYPSLPPTATILANLGAEGEVAVFYYPDSGLYHYAVVESAEPFIVTDTNYGSATKKTRTESGHNLIGFYSLE